VLKQAGKKEGGLGEAKNNLLRFFDLLLKIDRRINPQRYKSEKKKIYLN
jgi:hypothetical protein